MRGVNPFPFFFWPFPLAWPARFLRDGSIKRPRAYVPARGVFVTEITLSRRVSWGEVDSAGIVFYPNYFQWFDTATHDLFRANGLSLKDLAREGVVVPILSVGAEFKAPLHYDEEFRLRSWFTDLTEKTFRVRHALSSTDGKVLSEGWELRGWARKSPEGIHLEPIPARHRAVLAGGP